MRTVVAACTCALLLGCSADRTAKEKVEWFPIPNAYAKCFQVLANGEQRKVIVFGPGGRNDTVAVYRITTEPDHRDIVENKTVVLQQLNKVAVLSTTHLPFIAALDRRSTVVGIAHVKQLRDAKWKGMVEEGNIREVGAAEGVDREQLLLAAPQAVFAYPFGRSSIQGALAEIPTVAVTEYLEEHPLGRAEWIRFFGLLLNTEAKADSLFNAIERRYDALRVMNAQLKERPRVFFCSAWQGQWHVPPGNSYMARLIADAGGDYCFAEREASGNVALDLETVVNEARSASYFGMVLAHGGHVGARDLTGGDARIGALRAVRTGGFYLDSERSDVFGKALLEPDIVLLDLRDVFHPALRRRKPVYCFPIAQ